MTRASPPPSAWILRFAPLLQPGSQVLDLACGSGRHTRFLLDAGHRVTAVDRDLSGVADLRDRSDAEWITADLEADRPWPLGTARFDGVVVTNYLWRPILPDILRSLAPSGVLLYETFAIGNERFGKPSNPEFLLRPGELLTAFDAAPAASAASAALRVVAFEQGEITSPKPAIVQRICGLRLPTEKPTCLIPD